MAYSPWAIGHLHNSSDFLSTGTTTVPSQFDSADAVYNLNLRAILGDPATGIRLRIDHLPVLSHSRGEGVPGTPSLDSFTCKQAVGERAVRPRRGYPTSYVA